MQPNDESLHRDDLPPEQPQAESGEVLDERGAERANFVAAELDGGPTATEVSIPLESASTGDVYTTTLSQENLAVSETSAPVVALVPESLVSEPLPRKAVSRNELSESHPQQLAYSTFLSLLVVLILIITVRFTVPPLVESLRYSWYRGQLRAEYEQSGEHLQNVSLNSLSEASSLVSRRVGPSVVHINLLEVSNSSRRWLLGDGDERIEMMGQGSGVILDSAGHILTNHHVIEDAGRIEVALSDGRRVIARELGRDPFTDLAVIKIEADGLMPADWGNSDRMDVGSPVWAVGSPFGLERTVTFGILSGKHRIDLKGTRRWDNRDEKETMYSDLMQSDVAVNPGNSGGPLVNSSGQIVGINTAIVGETYIGISFAIPSNVARRVAEGLIKEGQVPRGWLGLSFKTVEDEFGNSPRGALVERWANDQSPAKHAGIVPGDLIVKFNGRDVQTYRMLTSMVAQTDIGSIVPIEVVREGKTISLQVEIGRRPNLQSDPR